MIQVSVPDSVGPEFSLTYGGGDPVVYQVGKDGTVEVERRHLDQFLAVVEGSTRYVAGVEPPPAAAQGVEPTPEEK